MCIWGTPASAWIPGPPPGLGGLRADPAPRGRAGGRAGRHPSLVHSQPRPPGRIRWSLGTQAPLHPVQGQPPGSQRPTLRASCRDVRQAPEVQCPRLPPTPQTSAVPPSHGTQIPGLSVPSWACRWPRAPSWHPACCRDGFYATGPVVWPRGCLLPPPLPESWLLSPTPGGQSSLCPSAAQMSGPESSPSHCPQVGGRAAVPAGTEPSKDGLGPKPSSCNAPPRPHRTLAQRSALTFGANKPLESEV